MQQTYQDKYIAIILTDLKNSERDLYPLTKNTSLPLLPIILYIETNSPLLHIFSPF